MSSARAGGTSPLRIPCHLTSRSSGHSAAPSVCCQSSLSAGQSESRTAIPPSANEFITLLKLTSLTSVISLHELLTVTGEQVSITFRFAELYAAATVYYLVIVSALMVAQAHLERRYSWRSRTVAAGSRRLARMRLRTEIGR